MSSLLSARYSSPRAHAHISSCEMTGLLSSAQARILTTKTRREATHSILCVTGAWMEPCEGMPSTWKGISQDEPRPVVALHPSSLGGSR
jgi:hypothetical protein